MKQYKIRKLTEINLNKTNDIWVLEEWLIKDKSNYRNRQIAMNHEMIHAILEYFKEN
jgi:hypothetical protein